MHFVPDFHYWISGTSLYLAGSFVFSVVTTLVGIKSSVKAKTFWVFAIIALVLSVLAWRSAAQQESELAEKVAKEVELLEGMKRLENSVVEKWTQALKDMRHEKPLRNHEPAPEVTLRFIYSKEPALLLINTSNAIAREIKWVVILWNIDRPERKDPLPIPASLFDWIRPHDQGGPQGLFNSQFVAPLVKPGDRLYGSASVICPTCSRGRSFWVHIEFGNGGWFSEIEEQKNGKIYSIKPRPNQNIGDAFIEAFGHIPANKRIPISDL